MIQVFRSALVLASCGWLAMFEASVHAANEPRCVEPSYDCGLLALATLLGLEGRPVPLDHLATILGKVEAGGRSLLTLRERAGLCGLHLTGLRLEAGGRGLDRPAIVFMDKKPHGHYLIVRPVGQSGRLVQVIDAGHEPLVIDADRLEKAPGWTGIALVPSRPSWPLRAFVLMVSFAILVSFLGRLWSDSKTQAQDRSPPKFRGEVFPALDRGDDISPC